ncbi:MAG TPA: cysteine--tRNA ligase [Candidatus Woesearchaeota archaeon]|nr:cysteine--tRNA ligase [Candidatus Woesearchaeota archaeon]
MPISFYNTLTRKKEKFIPISADKVTIYSCGPTVYNSPHIGNLRAFVFVDILVRYLRYRGYNVVNVMNLTDVEDKSIKASIEAKTPITQFTQKYIDLFFSDIKEMGCIPSTYYPRATDNIPEMIEIIKALTENKHTYVADGSVYFKISSFKDYGKLANLDIKTLKKNADGRLSLDEYEKEDAKDFVVWKAHSESDGEVFWESPFGKGRPGWHIECSAMSTKYLGQPIDIHTGGVDLIFPHHTNEIAQSEGATKKKFVNYWLHSEHLKVDGKKMSKSLGNFYTLNDIKKLGFSPLALRYFFVSNNYRVQINYTNDVMVSSTNSIKKLNDFVFFLKNIKSSTGDDANCIIEESREKFIQAMDDDLNSPIAFSSIFDLISKTYKINLSKESASNILDYLREINSILGIIDFSSEEGDIDLEIEQLIEKRDMARKAKDFKTADNIRDELLKRNIELIDSPQGTIFRRNK